MRSWFRDVEDMVLRTFFDSHANGLHVYLGARYPLLFSNNYYFYRKGRGGININAMPVSMALFNKLRSRDTKREIRVPQKAGEFDYCVFN